MIGVLILLCWTGMGIATAALLDKNEGSDTTVLTLLIGFLMGPILSIWAFGVFIQEQNFMNKVVIKREKE